MKLFPALCGVKREFENNNLNLSDLPPVLVQLALACLQLFPFTTSLRYGKQVTRLVPCLFHLLRKARKKAIT